MLNNSTSLPLAIDLHADTLQRVLDEGLDLSKGAAHNHVDIPRMRQGGVGTQFFSIWVNPKFFPAAQAVDRAWRLINALKEQLLKYPTELELATTTTDIERINQAGRIAAAMGIEGGHAINGRIELVEAFFQAGVRYMTLSWSNSNEICGASTDEGRERGLSPFGREVVALMNQLGMVVDISHVSDKTFYEALTCSSKPMVASHSNLRSICPHPRNLTDDMLRALAAQGGICCISYYPSFLDEGFYKVFSGLGKRLAEKVTTIRQQYKDDPKHIDYLVHKAYQEEYGQIPQVSYQKVVDHIEQAIKIAGIDHVGLGSDYDGIAYVPVGLEDISKLPILAQELAQRGYQSEDIAKIFYGNIMRVFAANQVG